MSAIISTLSATPIAVLVSIGRPETAAARKTAASLFNASLRSPSSTRGLARHHRRRVEAISSLVCYYFSVQAVQAVYETKGVLPYKVYACFRAAHPPVDFPRDLWAFVPTRGCYFGL